MKRFTRFWHVPGSSSRHARIALACLFFALSALACSRSTDEERIRAAISGMQVAMEAGQPGDFMEHVGTDFTGAGGDMDRERLHNLLRAQVLANARIGVTVGPIDVQLQGERATVTFDLALSGGNQRWLPERAGTWRIVSGWREESGQWRCINAQWERTL
jgi:hypothetical protein